MAPQRLARWAVPIGLTAAVVGASLMPSAAAEPDLPARSAADLLIDLQSAEVEAMSGTVSVHADLGLPDLPALGGPEHGLASGTDLMSVLSGTSTVRVWADQDLVRVALHGTLGERDWISDGTQVWTWSSADQTATHLTLATGTAPEHPAIDQAVPPMTPAQVTDLVLARIDGTTTLATGPTTVVAGRPAYELVVAPAEAGSLIGSIRVAVDAAQMVPTRVQVWAVGAAAPAVEVAFTEVAFVAPDPSVFQLEPPTGVVVEEHVIDPADVAEQPGTGPAGPPPTTAVLGAGWARVLVTSPVEGTPAASLEQSLSVLPQVSGPWGSGHLLTSTLFSALLTDDGRLLVGAVDGQTLQRAAADPAAETRR